MNSEDKFFQLKEYETAVKDTSLVSLRAAKKKSNLRETTLREMSEERRISIPVRSRLSFPEPDQMSSSTFAPTPPPELPRSSRGHAPVDRGIIKLR